MSSAMLTSLSRPTRPLHIRPAGFRVVGRSSVVLLRSTDQRRGFRFGMWASYLDSEFQREMRRRSKALKYKQLAGLNRILSWENHPLADQATRILRRTASQYWRTKAPRSEAKTGGCFRQARTPDNPTGVRPGNSIEDAERDILEDLLFGHFGHDKASASRGNCAKATVRGFEDRSAPRPNRPEHQSTSTSQPPRQDPRAYTPYTIGIQSTIEPDYVIDPITNRKVHKVQAKTSIDEALAPASTTHKHYRSQFAQFEPPAAPEPTEPFYSDGPPPASELKEYRNVQIDPNPGVQSTAGRQPVLESEDYVRDHASAPGVRPSHDGRHSQYTYKGVSWHREDGMKVLDESDFSSLLGIRSAKEDNAAPPSAPRTSSPAYNDLDKYKPILEDAPQVPEDPSEQYNDLDKYKPVMGREAPAPTNTTPRYDDLDKYTPVMDKAPLPAEEPSSNYNDLDKYKPVRHNEPDGRPAGYAEKDVYKDLPLYDTTNTRKVKGQPADYTERKPYNDLDKYGAVRYNEPDGKPAGYVVQEVYNDLHKYNAFMYNEPDGKPPGYQGPACEARELNQYGAIGWNEPHGKPDVASQNPVPEPQEEVYQAVPCNEPVRESVTTSAEHSSAKLNQYDAVRHNEPDGKAPGEPDIVAKVLEEFDLSAESTRKNSYIEPTAEERAEDVDLLRASDVRSSAGATKAKRADPTGSDQRCKLESLLSEHYRASEVADQEASRALKRLRGSPNPADDALVPGRTYTGTFARDFPEDFQGSWTSALPTSTPVQEEVTSQKTSRLVSSLNRGLWPPSRSRLTGAARERAICDPYSTIPQGLETSYADECDGKSTWPAYVRTYGTLTNDSEQSSASSSSSSSSSSSAASPGRCSSDSDSASSSSSPSNAPDSTAPASKQQQTVYKVLAYNPETQTVSEAETTSTVPDTSRPLPPTAALLRLSNPTKFFPHFAPLREQGFEIASGSGDVLVFRKVAADVPSPTASSAAAATTTMQEQQQQAVEDAVEAATTESPSIPVNPIDMTGAPVARHLWPVSANFASPTGYVNYDPDPLDYSTLPPPPPVQQQRRKNTTTTATASSTASTAMSAGAAAEAATPRFKSGINVRRVEDVYSGGGASAEGSDARAAPGKGRPGVAKRVAVGAAWLAGVSYALGVVGEYFKANGKAEGGKGPWKF